MGENLAVQVLLDTHAFLWWIADSDRLSGRAHSVIEDELNNILVSAASVWEIATKLRIGKLPGWISENWKLPSRMPNMPDSCKLPTVTHSTRCLPHKPCYADTLSSRSIQHWTVLVSGACGEVSRWHGTTAS